MHVIVIPQMAEALLVIMDRTFLNSTENGSKSCGPGDVQRRLEDTRHVCIWKIVRVGKKRGETKSEKALGKADGVTGVK